MNFLSTIGALSTAALACLFSFLALASDNPTRVEWSLDAGGWIGSPAAVAGDRTVYVGARGVGVHAVSAEGKRKWTFRDRGWDSYSPIAIGADYTVYAAGRDSLFALTPEGETKWQYRGKDLFSMPALGRDGMIYVMNRDQWLYALASAGQMKWRYHMRGNLSTAPTTPAITADGSIIATGPDGHLHALSADGSRLWRERVPGEGVLTAPVLSRDGAIYVASSNSARGIHELHAFDGEGKLQWSFTGGSSAPFPSHAPAIGADGTLYWVANSLTAVGRDGLRRWGFASDQMIMAPAVVAEDGTIYLTGSAGKVYAVSPAGGLLWSFAPGANIAAPVALGGNGLIYIGTTNSFEEGAPGQGTLYALTAAQGDVADAWTELTPERLIDCANVGDMDCVQQLLASGVAVDGRDATGATALIRSCGRGHFALARSLLAAGANPNAQDKGGGTALMNAVRFDFQDVLDLLLEHRADPNLASNTGATAIMAASGKGNVIIVSGLLARGADPDARDQAGNSAIISAAEWGQLEVVNLLLNHGANPDARREGVYWTATALTAAASNGHVDVIQRLLLARADLELSDASGRTALMIAAGKGNIAAVQALLDAGALKAAKDQRGNTARDHASRWNSSRSTRNEILSLLK